MLSREVWSHVSHESSGFQNDAQAHVCMKIIVAVFKLRVVFWLSKASKSKPCSNRGLSLFSHFWLWKSPRFLCFLLFLVQPKALASAQLTEIKQVGTMWQFARRGIYFLIFARTYAKFMSLDKFSLLPCNIGAWMVLLCQCSCSRPRVRHQTWLQEQCCMMKFWSLNPVTQEKPDLCPCSLVCSVAKGMFFSLFSFLASFFSEFSF